MHGGGGGKRQLVTSWYGGVFLKKWDLLINKEACAIKKALVSS